LWFAFWTFWCAYWASANVRLALSEIAMMVRQHGGVGNILWATWSVVTSTGMIYLLCLNFVWYARVRRNREGK
jgi:hypothetical protein